MNKKQPLGAKTAQGMVQQVLNKLEKAEATDIYYLCIAIGQGLSRLSPEVVPSDVYYGIYLKQLQMSDSYDLQQLS